MNLSLYPIRTAGDCLEYMFNSEGPKGAIKKIVRYTKVNSASGPFYNLGFGDWDEATDTIDDFVVSNNEDAEKVLATVAQTALHFTEHYPGYYVFVTGSTPARTRRYQMGLNRYWHEVEPLFEVYGLIENEGFKPFVKGRNYRSFLVKRKSSNLAEAKQEEA